MATNIEIKAVVHDWERANQLATSLSDTPMETLEQADTFFTCPKGRLKLRKFSATQGELIAYHREDVKGTKSSHYLITKTSEPDLLRDVLAESMDVLGVVKKTRHLYLRGQTRIHLDQVAGLGNFLELEVVLRPDQSSGEGEKIAHQLMQQLGVETNDLVAGAYLDLIRSAQA